MVPGNVDSLATYISPTATIDDTTIHFRPGRDNEQLLSIPFETPESAIVITLGINSTFPNKHSSNPLIVVSDGYNSNSFYIVDVHHYDTTPPCYPLGYKMDETRVSAGTKVPPIFKFTMIPSEHFGYCETAQDGGYINVGEFFQQLDLTKKKYYFEIHRSGWGEQYFIHYISIETI